MWICQKECHILITLTGRMLIQAENYCSSHCVEGLNLQIFRGKVPLFRFHQPHRSIINSMTGPSQEQFIIRHIHDPMSADSLTVLENPLISWFLVLPSWLAVKCRSDLLWFCSPEIMSTFVEVSSYQFFELIFEFGMLKLCRCSICCFLLDSLYGFANPTDTHWLCR